jgi:hypothetical protein
MLAFVKNNQDEDHLDMAGFQKKKKSRSEQNQMNRLSTFANAPQVGRKMLGHSDVCHFRSFLTVVQYNGSAV